ncbi:MAG: hypothetical protein BWY85_00257 [Firmicutes bacterium ADurb.Bin506]|nr:MAG: hypothetical protein BWY85_00257 [Firmicutes bacterium ADurb.Bin506]
MKRALLETVKVSPYTSAAAIDREGFLSGILGAKVGAPTGSPTALKLKVVFTECDTESGTYAVVSDKRVVVDKELDASGAIELETAAAGGDLHNIDLDFVGCKRFVKATISVVCTGGTTPSCSATAALALGDKNENPV